MDDNEKEKSLEEAARLTQEIRRSCVIVAVRVSNWEGQRQLDEGFYTLESGRRPDQEMISAPRLKLLESKWMRKLRNIETAIRRAVYRNSCVFREGVYVVPRSRFAALMREIHEHRRQYEAKATELAEEWPEVRASLIDKLKNFFGPEFDEKWNRLEKTIPKDAKAFRDRFGVSLSIWQFGQAISALVRCRHLQEILGQQRNNLLHRLRPLAVDQKEFDKAVDSGEDALEVKAFFEETGRLETQRFDDEEAEEFLNEAHREAARLTAELADNLFTEPAAILLDEVKMLAAKLTSKQRLTSASFEGVKRAYEKLQSFSFAIPEHALEPLKSLGTLIEKELATTADIKKNAQALADAFASELSRFNAVMDQPRQRPIRLT